MRTRRQTKSAGQTSRAGDVGGALAALDAAALRALVTDLLQELDEEAHARVVRSLVDRAARASSGWAPAPIADKDVADTVAFVEAAMRVGDADPRQVDELLDRGTRAFLRRNYAAAHRIFDAVLRPIGEAEINLGQDETVCEVLGADLDACAAQYAVSAYMVGTEEERAPSVMAALHSAEAVWNPDKPLEEMERVAVEPLPGLESFLPRWRAVVEKEALDERRGSWGGPRSWLREVTWRTEGTEGLAKTARTSRSDEDYRAWCFRLVAAGDWKGALAAFDDAAERVRASEYARANFLDGAVLAAQQLGRRDVPARLERAWRGDPTMARLCRWLGSAASRGAMEKRALAALDACPAKEGRQHALLQILAGNPAAAAKLLASAPGLGWSGKQHPGHLLFPLFQGLLSGTALADASLPAAADLGEADDMDEFVADDDKADPPVPPRLETPAVSDLLTQAGVWSAPAATERAALLGAMRQAAERRLAGVTEQKRRRYYDHAAELVGAVVSCDPSPQTARWVASLRETYSRYPALRGALDRHIGGAKGRESVR